MSELFLLRPAEAALKRKPKHRGLLWALCLCFGVFLGWAAWAEMDEVCRGAGQVVPSGRVQQIQNLEGGIVREFLVREGDLVDKDQLLLRIDNEYAGSQYRDNLGRSLEAMAAIARIKALISGGEPEFAPSVGEELMQRQRDLLYAERERNAAELAVLVSQKELRLQEVAEQEEKLRQMEQSLGLAQRQRELARPLLQSRAYSPMDFLGLEQKVQALSADMATLRLAIPRGRIAAQEAENRHRLRRAEIAAKQREDLNRLEAELISLSESLSAGSDRVSRAEVRSPVRGTVKKIYVTTVGGVIKPGEDIMDIVPVDDALIIEARISPSDMAFIEPGQRATVRLSAYDFSIYGGLEGVVDQVGADTLQGQNGEIYYPIKVRTLKKSLEYRGQEMRIMPGMQAQVDVLTGKKTVLQYLIKPIAKAKQSALREH